MSLRESMNKNPWLGWAAAGVLFLVAVLLAVRNFGGGSDSYSTDRMTEVVTIKFTDTGDTIEIPRGRLIKQILDQGGELDPNKGLINPKTKQPTGFLFDKAEWDRMITQLQADSGAEAGAQLAEPREK